MASEQKIAFLKQMFAAASIAAHKWPAAAACEAVVETGWGEHYPKGSCNVLGIKAFGSWKGAKVAADGTEQKGDGSFTAPASMLWRVYPSFEACFADQMIVMQTDHLHRYDAALAATTIESYIVAECKVWSTGMLKGQTVLQELRDYGSLLR